VVREFANSLNRETDFSREARSVILYRTAMADFPDLWIPDVVTECSNGAVLTLFAQPSAPTGAHRSLD
jgi:ubiquinone biosynthesis protein